MRERISGAESIVMEVLWAHAPITAAGVLARLTGEHDWSASTVKTLLARLTDKGLVSYELDGRRHIYRPKIEREVYVADESLRLVDRLFGGRSASLVAHLAEANRLTPEDITEIEALIREIKS